MIEMTDGAWLSQWPTFYITFGDYKFNRKKVKFQLYFMVVWLSKFCVSTLNCGWKELSWRVSLEASGWRLGVSLQCDPQYREVPHGVNAWSTYQRGGVPDAGSQLRIQRTLLVAYDCHDDGEHCRIKCPQHRYCQGGQGLAPWNRWTCQWDCHMSFCSRLRLWNEQFNQAQKTIVIEDPSRLSVQTCTALHAESWTFWWKLCGAKAKVCLQNSRTLVFQIAFE